MIEYRDIEEQLRRFRPLNPPTELRQRVLTQLPDTSRPAGLRYLLWALGGGVLAFLAVWGWFWTNRSQAVSTVASAVLTQSQRDGFAAQWNAKKRVALPATVSGAQVIVVEFVDWLCRPCEPVNTQYRQIVNRYAAARPGMVKLVAMDWPWDATCNAEAPRTLHPGACEAAVAARMARDRNRADEMTDWLLANAGRLETGGGTSAEAMIASEVKRRFGADIGDERTRLLDSIRQDISVGRAAGVQSTPTVFVNGKLATDGSGGQLSPAYADLAIQLELRRLDRQ